MKTQVWSGFFSVQFSSWLLISSPVSKNKAPLPPVLEYIMHNSTVAWFLTRFLTRLCGHNCFPPELLRVFSSGRIRNYSFKCPVYRRSSVFCLWVDGFCFFEKPIWHGGRWRVKRFKWSICLAFRDNLGKNWDLTKEKLRPLQWALLVPGVIISGLLVFGWHFNTEFGQQEIWWKSQKFLILGPWTSLKTKTTRLTCLTRWACNGNFPI